MPPRRTRPLKSLKGRVQRIVTRADFDKAVSKSRKRLVVVHYYSVSVTGYTLCPGSIRLAASMPRVTSQFLLITQLVYRLAELNTCTAIETRPRTPHQGFEAARAE